MPGGGAGVFGGPSVLEHKLVEMLQGHAGETGRNEGAVEVLQRLLADHHRHCPLRNPPVLNDGGPDCVGWVHDRIGG